MKREHILKMVMLAMLVAIGVVISPILRVEGMCPMALRRNGLLAKFQHDLGAKVYDTTAAKRAAQSTK